MTPEQDEQSLPNHLLQLSGNAPIEIFPFVSVMHREVVLRHHDGESQDIELTPEEADRVADLLRDAAKRARAATVTSTGLDAPGCSSRLADDER